jgi:hypothetical protein
MILATPTQTMINGIPVSILVPNLSREENPVKRHSFQGEPGNLEEAIAALKKIQAYVS